MTRALALLLLALVLLAWRWWRVNGGPYVSCGVNYRRFEQVRNRPYFRRLSNGRLRLFINGMGWRWWLRLEVGRPLHHLIVRKTLAFFCRSDDNELAQIEETLRLAIKERDELRLAIHKLNTLVRGDEPFYSWQRIYQEIERGMVRGEAALAELQRIERLFEQ